MENCGFRGINEISLDNKGRISLPIRYRAILENDGGSLVITIDTEETCLLLYQTANWLQIEEKLQQLPSFNPATRRLQRLLIGHATDVRIKNGRILVPAPLLKHANLSKKVVMIGQGNKFEIWDETIWEAKRGQWLLNESSNKDWQKDEMGNFSL